MATSNIDVKILAEFLGKSAFKQADLATKQLTNSVKKLGSAVGLSFGVYGIKSEIPTLCTSLLSQGICRP